MKSIKEKTEEWADMYPSCGMADKSFTKGANYVLECIENIIVNNEDNTLNMARCLVDCIEQLKK